MSNAAPEGGSAIIPTARHSTEYSHAVDISQPDAGEGHPESTTIDIGSLAINPSTENGLLTQLAKFPNILTKPFQTQYFRLYTPLKTKREKLLLFLAVLFSLAAGVPLPIIGVIFGKLINNFPPSEDQLKAKLGQLMGVAVAYFFITWGWATFWGMIGERIARGLREQVLRKVVGMDMAYFEVECPDIAHRLTADTQTIQMGVSEKCGLFLQSIAYFIAAFVTGFVLNPHLTGVLFAAIVPSMGFVIIFGTGTVSKFAKYAQESNAKAGAVAEGAIGAVQVVQAFGALNRLADEHLMLMHPAVRNGIKKSIYGAFMLGMVYFVAYSANALAFYQGSKIIADGGFGKNEGAGTVYTVVFLILDASFVVGQFGPFLQTFALAAASGEKILTIIDHPQPTINPFSEEGDKISVPEKGVDIQLSDITFAYPARPAVKVLNNVSLNFKAGTLTAIVGPSGSGKSTVAGLLLRFYDPESGSVSITGANLKSLNLKNYRSHVALVDQEPVLFSGTILENIRHGLLHLPDLDEDEIVLRCHQAARDANAFDFISKLPDGFNTKIGGTGATQLSGGQRQRIAIARAVVKNPAILVLDEPTSALDATGEAVVLEALERASSAAGRTTVMIAHRLSTVKSADNIIVMTDGNVIEQGTHFDLIAKDGAYRNLVNAQKLLSSSSSLSSIETNLGDTESPAEKDLDLKTDITENNMNDTTSDLTTEKEKTYSSGYLIRRAVQFSLPDLWLIFLGLLASIVTGGIIVGESIIFGNLVSALNNRTDMDEMMKKASFFSLMFFILALIALLSHTTSGSSFGIVSERLIRRIRDKSLRTILRQDISWFEEPGHSPTHLISMLNMDTAHLSGLSGIILGTICTVVVSMTGGIILAHVVAWKVAVVILAAVPIMVVSGFLRLRILSKFEQRHETAYLAASGLATEACNAIRTVASLGREQDVIRLYHDAVEKPYQESLKFIISGNVWLALSLAITYFVYALAYWWGAMQVRVGFCTDLEFFIVLPALLFSAQSSGQMFSLAPEVTRAKTAAQSIFTLHDQKPTIDVNEHPEEIVSGEKKSEGKVEFRNVNFTYKSRKNSPVLQSLSFTAQPGQFIALVGPSGAGKSSAVGLLERFYDVNSGSILIDGVDIRSVDVRRHRSRISLVGQEACLFPGSILFNVGLGAEGAHTSEDVIKVCKMCGIHDFIMSLPDGYETNCGTNGSQLSGGQKQRVALARAIIRNPAILLLDEATSALDSHSEKLVKEAIAAASRGRTCIAVAHRLASIQHADRIFVLSEGKVVESGNHEELVALNGVYASMSRQQTPT
ncbi:ABC transporter-like protein [Peziza echinospora]|nr:ABC transporter-like protein [Peziza echinospora]